MVQHREIPVSFFIRDEVTKYPVREIKSRTLFD